MHETFPSQLEQHNGATLTQPRRHTRRPRHTQPTSRLTPHLPTSNPFLALADATSPPPQYQLASSLPAPQPPARGIHNRAQRYSQRARGIHNGQEVFTVVALPAHAANRSRAAASTRAAVASGPATPAGGSPSSTATPARRTTPLTVFYHNCNGLRDSTASMLIHQLRTTDTSEPTAPLVYALVEAGAAKHPGIPSDWEYRHVDGRREGGGVSGGVSILSHGTCPIERFEQQPIPVPASGGELHASAVAYAVLAPHGRERFLLVVVYVHPLASRKRDCIEAVSSAIDAVLVTHSQLPALVVGDFNARHAKWHDDRDGRSNGSAGDTALAAAIDDMDLTVHNQPGVYTRVSETGEQHTRSIIDLVLSRPSELVVAAEQRHNEYHVHDHIPFAIDLALEARTTVAQPQPSRSRVMWDAHRDPQAWKPVLAAAVSARLAPLQPLLDSLEARNEHEPVTDPQARLEAVYGQVEAAVREACLSVVGVKQRSGSTAQQEAGWTRHVRRTYSQLRAAARVRARARSRAQEDGGRERLLELERAIAAATAVRKQWRASMQQGRREAREQLATLVMDKDSKLRYAALRRHQRSTHTSLGGIKNAAGGMPADITEALDNLCGAFIADSEPRPLDARTTQQLCDTARALHATAASSSDASDSWTFTAEQVEQQTQRRTCKTAAGPDAILPLFLRYGGETLWAALATIFNYSWRHSVTPQAWREANVAALYKGKGDRSEPTSYRPISITSGIARTFEHLIQQRLAERLAPALAQAQFGFRARRSTTDAILQLLSPVQYLCGRHKTGAKRRRTSSADKRYRKVRCAALFLDIQKAFDRVDHAILLNRLHAKGVQGAAWRWVRCFLTDRRMRCVNSQHESHWQPVRHGVPQGCVLSPLLFLVFIDELIGTIRQDADCSMISPIFYADDGVLGPSLRACRQHFERHSDVARFEQEYAKQLKAAAAHLNRWCVQSRMHFGEAKTKVVVFDRGTGGSHVHFDDIHLCGYTVGVADSYDYLGLTVARDLTWTKHATRKLAKARDVARRLTAIALNARPVQPAVIRELVLSCLVPSFDYGIEFWGIGLPEAYARPLQAAMAKPLRVACGLPLTAHQLSTLRGAGVSPVATHTQHKQMQHLLRVSRLLHEDAGHPTARLYKQLCGMHSERHRMLDTHVSAPLPVYLVHAVLPFAMGAAGNDQLTHPARHTERRQAAQERAPSAAVGRHGQRHGPQQQPWDGWAALQDLNRPPLLAALDAGPSDPSTRLRALRDEAANIEWLDSHGADHRGTTAPMTGCLHAPDDSGAPPLRFLSARHAQRVVHKRLVGRMRLLYGRAYTATVRHRFPTDAAAAAASTLCPHEQCTAAGHDETIEHLLLHCPHYATARAALASALRRLGHQLDMRVLLNPPGTAGTARYTEMYKLTDVFLREVGKVRRANGLPRLDGCPHYSRAAAQPAAPEDRRQRKRRAQPAAERPHKRRAMARAPASGPVAPAAPLPLDTG